MQDNTQSIIKVIKIKMLQCIVTKFLRKQTKQIRILRSYLKTQFSLIVFLKSIIHRSKAEN